MNKTELANQIRFALEQLSAQNGHHQFEHLSRAFTAKKICSNVLPATGPVSAGGDQGRDFETFRSYLRAELGPHGAYLGLISDVPLAFICTLQATDVGRKIVADAGKVMAAGEPVVRIYAFCSADVPKGQRSKLQHAVSENHGVTLEVIDGQALAEQLAEPDSYWIAEQYLGMPAEFAPPPPRDEPPLPEWYVSSRGRWRARSPQPTLGDLLDIHRGLRHATRREEARPDLPFWLALVRVLAEGEAPHDVRQRARYELTVAVLRGTDDLRPADQAVKAFFDEFGDEREPARLDDAQILLTYAIEARMRGITGLSAVWLAEQNALLRVRVRALVADEPRPNASARLLQVLGSLAMQPDPVRVSRGVEPDNQVAEEGLAPPRPTGAALLVDVAEGMSAWIRMAVGLDAAPLFPAETFAEVLTLMTPLLVDQRGWRDLVARVDRAVERSAGSGAAAANARDRAVGLRRAGRVRAAIDELHEAKVGWWSGEALRGALLAMLFIAQGYKELGLPVAAKQYALAIAVLAQSSGDQSVLDLLPRAILIAAECDYVTGAWCSAVELTEIGIFASRAYTQGGADPDDEQLGGAITHLGMALLAARDHAPELLPGLRDSLQRTGVSEFVCPEIEELNGWTPEKWNEICDEQIYGRPFADAGQERVIRFAALGTTWTVRSSNEFADARAAERFSAAAQILLVELADVDLCSVPAEIDVRVSTSPAPNELEVTRAIPEPGNSGRLWAVRLTRFEQAGSRFDPDTVALELLVTLSLVMRDVSLLPDERYLEAINDAYSRGLGHKLAVGRPYDELADIVPRTRYDQTGRDKARPPFDAARASGTEHPELAWKGGPGPGYDLVLAREKVANRYDNGLRFLRVTLPTLRGDTAFRPVVAELRRRGWLDWHILMAVLNIQVNWRLQAKLTPSVLGDPKRRTDAMTARPEPESADAEPVPPSQFTLAAMCEAQVMALRPSSSVGTSCCANGPPTSSQSNGCSPSATAIGPSTSTTTTRSTIRWLRRTADA